MKKEKYETCFIAKSFKLPVIFLIIWRHHQINDHAGQTDVKPDRHRPTDDFFVLIDLHRPAVHKGKKRERHDNGGQDAVSNQNGKVNGPNEAMSAVLRRFRGNIVERQIRYEKEQRRRKSGQNKSPVDFDVFFADRKEGRQQKDKRKAIKNGVEPREDRDIEVHFSLVADRRKEQQQNHGHCDD